MPTIFNDLDQELLTTTNNQGLHILLHYNLKQEQTDSDESLTTTTTTQSDLISAKIDEMTVKIANMVAYDQYKGKTNRAIKKYIADFVKFFKVYCPIAAKNYISNLSNLIGGKPIKLNCSLTDNHGLNYLDFARINQILQDPANNVNFANIINLAIKLQVGQLRAVYTGDRTQIASYVDCGGSSGDWLFSCKKQPAWASYEVTVLYQLPGVDRSIPIMSLKFVNQAATSCYQLQLHKKALQTIINHSNQAKQDAEKINKMPLAEFLQTYWHDSKLVKDSIIVHPISDQLLSEIIDAVIPYILANTNTVCQEFRAGLFASEKEFFSAKLDQIDARANSILKYLELTGIPQEKLAGIVKPLVREQFENDFVNLSLAEYAADGSRSLVQKCKNMVYELKENIDNLLYSEVDSEASSDQEAEERCSLRP